MKRSLVIATAAAVLIAVAGMATPASANLLTNGSFENTTNFTDNTGDDTDNVALGDSTTMPGWTVVGAHYVSWIGPTNPFSLSAADGQYFLDLTGYIGGCPCSGVSQTIATQPGQQYQLTFDLGSSTLYGLPDSITAGVTGGTPEIFTSTNTTSTNEWELETLDFVATGSTTTISLTGETADNYAGLDNVSVNAIGDAPVPEPSTITLLGAGLLGLAAARRRIAWRWV